MVNLGKLFQTRVFALLLACIMAAGWIPVGEVRGEGTLLKTGNYYFGPAPNGGSLPDKGATGLVSSANGVLLDGKTTTYAGWMGSGTGTPGTVQVVFDLLKDYPLDSINVVLNSPNSAWGFKEFTLKYRPEAVTDYYYIAAKHIRTPGIVSTSPSSTWNYSVNVPMSNKKARFIVIDIKRPHAFQHIPLTEVQIYKGTGEEGVNPGPALTAEQMALELKKDGLMADKYGQWVYETWPGKVVSDEQLQQEYANEANALSNVSLDLSKYDQYGGVKNGGQYKNTGYFRLQKIDNKWWFITPDGYKFILKGVDATSIWEWGYGTPLKKADGTPRNVFEELPDPVAYAPAYVNDSNGERVSFVVANVMKKYGSNFESKWEDITKKRLIDWGFNAFSKWTKPRHVKFPYIQVLQDPGSLKRIQWTYDVFDPQNESIIENALSSQLQTAKNDPWLIGYTYDNEAGWNTDIVKEVLTYNSTSTAKSAFVDFLAPRYNNDLAVVNQLLGTSAASFTALKDISINMAKVPAADVSDYIKLASRAYFTTVKKVINKYDTNHLFLGASIVPTWRTSLEWDSAAMEFVDAFSVDNYVNDATWISRYETYGKPLLNLEYTFSTTQRGLSPVNSGTTVGSTADRGYAFKSFVESQISHPLFVGSGWFSYYDQAVTWRKDGENFNIGLVNQQDQPYTDMVNIMKTVNAGLEQVHDNASNPPSFETTAMLTPAQPDGQNGWYVNPATLALSASNQLSGGFQTEYSPDGGATWELYSSPVTFDQDGQYTVKYHSKDQTGNEEAIKTISLMVDKTAPTTVAIVSPAAPDGSNGWYKSDVTVSLAVYQDVSGLAKTEYRVNHGGWISYTGSIPAFGEGNYKIDYRSVDQAGNVEQIRTVEFKIDKTAPLVTVQLDKTSLWPANHKMVDILAALHPTDPASGIDCVLLTSVTSNEPDSGLGDIEADFGTAATWVRLRADRSGGGSGRVYTITYTVTDKAGHKKDVSATVTVPHDRGAAQ
ncbi:OmpL47-type beta-barrel domain-containing protein [Paenibacillus silviterrae]|uniref:OmpL47-type beta-barrel domain-containing protein n=1 Tax=Paenibacillus silviterrae TaxID=3242194 RepID=UPI0025431004|nr:Ig-like domain repeat protein [Paenibacillus chinjuensis]